MWIDIDASLPLLNFDFNPIHLRSPEVESVATLTDLTRDPDLSVNTIEVVRPELSAADQLAAGIRTIPEVAAVRTLSSFVPEAQSEKLAIIADAANLLDLALNPIAVAPPPSDAEVLASLGGTADSPSSAPRRITTTRRAEPFPAAAKVTPGRAAPRPSASPLPTPRCRNWRRLVIGYLR